jgi:hypothetical protein
MKKLFGIFLFTLFAGLLFALPPTPQMTPTMFVITPVAIYHDRAIIAFPRSVSFTNTAIFNLNIDNGLQQYQTTWNNASSNAYSVTTTVYFTGSIASHTITAWETGNNTYYYLSNPLSIILPPLNDTPMSYRDSLAYNPQNTIFQSWSQSVSATVDVMDNSFNASVFIDEIIVSGAVAGNVAIKINGVTQRTYSYSAGTTIPSDTLAIKLLIPKGQYLEDQLVTGTTGVHSISIIGEYVR